MAELLVRRAVPEDAPTLARVHVAGWSWTYRGVLPDGYLDAPERRPRREAQWRGLLEDGQSIFLASRGPDVLGLASVGTSRDEDASDEVGELSAIYLRDASLAGRGVGRALMDAALDALRARFREATLWVLDTNERARRFYARTGWRLDGATKTETVADTPLPHVRYRIALG